MKCQILFPEKNKKNISKCQLLKILPRVLSVNTCNIHFYPTLKDQNAGHVCISVKRIIIRFFFFNEYSMSGKIIFEFTSIDLK